MVTCYITHKHGTMTMTFASVNVCNNLVLMVLVDGDRHGKGYVTPIVVNANEILFLPIRRFFVEVNTPLPTFCSY